MFSAVVSAQGVVINEVLASNTITNTDADGTYQDWVELYNSGGAAVNLNGYGLSDDPTLPHKWTFPNVTIAPGAYLLVFCSDKNLTNPASQLHTNFKISASGEIITLSNPGGTAVNVVPAVEMASDISYGRLPNGTGPFVYFASVTPGALNAATGYSAILPPPAFSKEPGFYTSGFSLTLSTTVTGATILYTLDGSEPDASHIGGTTYTYKNQYPEHPGQSTGAMLTQSYQTFQYSTPLNIVDRTSQPNKISAISSTYHFNPTYLPDSNIFKGTVVRAKVVKPGALASKTESRTYFVTPQGSDRFTLPVISLSISEDKLYDYNEGIYVAGVDFDTWRTENPTLEPVGLEDLANYYRRGMDHERVANMSYFVDGAQVINQDVGLRIHGGSSRDWQNKSFNIYSRADYGDETMNYAFFPNQPTAFERLVLRNSGADFYETLFKDALNQRLMKNLNVLTKGYQPTITFMNGEYWGILNLRDKFDDQYFERVFDIPGEEIDILESESVVEEGDNADYLAMLNYIGSNSLAVQANYDYIVTQLDPENFADYFISNIFFQNIDWPGNNIVYWRKKTAAYIPDAAYGHDGRWRWLAHDMDATFATNTENIALNSLAAATATNGPEWPNPAWSTLLLRKMLDNATFKNYFISRFADLMNTSFLSARVVSTIDEMKGVILPELDEQIARWQAPVDMTDFNYYINYEKDFANQRPAFQRNHIRSKFAIASNINVTLNVSAAAHGYVKINTINIKDGTDAIVGNPYPWTGIYFSNIPVKLKAIPNDGFVFSHWTGASTATTAEITITSAAAFSVTAVFVPDTTPAVSEPIYFWMMDGSMANNLPLESLNTTFEAGTADGVIAYQSCLVGYPFTSASPNWRKASMERRNSPTSINYIPEANNDLPFATSDMKGLQIKEPLQNGSLVNTMVFNFSTAGYKDIKFSFAAINELTNATGLLVDYSVNAGTPVWVTTALPASTLPLTAAFQLYEVDMTSIAAVNNNANLKIRLRFTGSNLTIDAGNRVTFNNIAVHGTETLATPDVSSSKFLVYPNPVTDVLKIAGLSTDGSYKIFTLDGRLIRTGTVTADSEISVNELGNGMYLLQVTSEGRTEVKKILKR
jgi:hypothetical protein